VVAIPWGFESPLPHHAQKRPAFAGFFRFDQLHANQPLITLCIAGHVSIFGRSDLARRLAATPRGVHNPPNPPHLSGVCFLCAPVCEEGLWPWTATQNWC
jgi:hypothetical protein